jgi:hypothetical protein
MQALRLLQKQNEDKHNDPEDTTFFVPKSRNFLKQSSPAIKESVRPVFVFAVLSSSFVFVYTRVFVGMFIVMLMFMCVCFVFMFLFAVL